MILALLACASPDSPWAWSKPTDPTITRDEAVVDTADTGNDTSDSGPTDSADSSSVDTSDTGAVDTSDTGSVDTSDTSVVDTSDTGAVDSSDTSVVDTSDTGDTSVVDTADTGATDTGTTDTSDTAVTDTSDTGGGTATYTVSPDAPTDWILEDLNPGSYRFGEAISPRDYISRVSGYYFIHST